MMFFTDGLNTPINDKRIGSKPEAGAGGSLFAGGFLALFSARKCDADFNRFVEQNGPFARYIP